MGKQSTESILQSLIAEKSILLNFFKSKLPLYHNSNIFFRDLQFVINAYLELKSMQPGYGLCEELTRGFLAELESKGEARQVSDNAWVLTMPQFKKGAAEVAENQ